MRYKIFVVEGLYCVFKSETIGYRMIAAYETKRQAVEAIERLREKGVR